MKKYTESDVLKTLQEMVDRTGCVETAAELGFSRTWVAGTLTRKHGISKRMWAALGYEKLPDSYVKTGDTHE